MVSSNNLKLISDVVHHLATFRVIPSRHQEGEAEVARRRPTGGREVQPGGARLLRSTYVGRAVPPVEENWDSGDEEEEAAKANEVEAEGVERRAE